jgi:hypothetical protein
MTGRSRRVRSRRDGGRDDTWQEGQEEAGGKGCRCNRWREWEGGAGGQEGQRQEGPGQEGQGQEGKGRRDRGKREREREWKAGCRVEEQDGLVRLQQKGQRVFMPVTVFTDFFGPAHI